MADNLELWHSVEKTDPKHVKAITGKAYSGTSPKPHWLVMRATETFGPCGCGWGFTIDERFVDGAMIEPGFYEKMHVAKVKVWYKWKGERGEVEHIGGTQFSGKRKNGAIFTDEDCAKKSVTDALVKALSMIGFAGDIFMGRYDDSNYVDETRLEFKKGAAAAAESERSLLIMAAQECLEIASKKGTAALADAWNGLAKDIQPDLKDLVKRSQPLYQTALAVDEQKKAA